MNLCEEGSHEEDPERHHAQGSHWGELDHDEEEVHLHVEQNKRGIMPKAATAEKYEGCGNEVILSKDGPSCDSCHMIFRIGILKSLGFEDHCILRI